MASNLTRKELKQDRFAVEVEHTVDYFAAHRKQATRYGAILLALVVVLAAVFYYRTSQHAVRQQVLGEAIALTTAPVGAAPPGGGPSFPSESAKINAITSAFTKIASDYSGSEEGYVAEYYLASRSADAGKMDEARRKFQDVADHAGANYASLAKFALAQIDAAENRVGEASNLLKDLMDHPTDLVSKTQATIAYAKAIAPARPEEARKLLTPIANERSEVSQVAIAALSDIPQK